jgi:hypothetical protein
MTRPTRFVERHTRRNGAGMAAAPLLVRARTADERGAAVEVAV